MENGLLKTFVDDSGFVRNEETMTELIEQFQDFQTFMMMYNCAIKEVRTKFEVLNDELSVTNKRNPIQMIKSRVKKPLSIVNKLKRKNFEMSMTSILDNINDVAGVRVICAFVNDIYDVADMFASQDDIRVLQVKDYIKNPKPNGYRSYHMIVEIPVFFTNRKQYMKVEVQLRTIAMDFWASLEHSMKYKKDIPDAENIMAQLKECAESIAATDLQMQEINDTINGKL
jgi:putative GTP pyrophosphokinase